MVSKKYKDLYIVGLGASAGGFEALQKFLEKIEPNENIAYVIVQHLDPNQPTMLGNLLSKYTPLPIEKIINKHSPKENIIYYCPPNKDLSIKNGKFYLTEPLEKAYPKPSINKFYDSLAIEKKEKAIGVILSGTGSDGAKGIESIHKNGGITIAEDEGAKYFSMPKAAIDTGVIDAVLTPELIAEGIPNVIQNRDYFVNQYEVKGSIQKVFDLLNKRTNIDFSSYKENTILRRIKKRMNETKTFDIDDYLLYLKANPNELEILKNELLIIVTSFFRGEDSFKELEKQLHILIKEKNNDTLRIWVSACATGEEAYTIAIIIKEILEKLDLQKKVTIFATDVSDIAIESARLKVYSSEQMIGVEKKYIEKYFEEHNTGYRPKKELRDMIIFSKHDIIKDPPFSNLDLVSCRNLLIYFNNDLQKVIMNLFYYALRFGGLLFLGQSETVGNLNNFFSTIHSKNKLYKKTSDIADIAPEALTYVHRQNFISRNKKITTDLSKVSEVDSSINKALAKEYGKNGVVIDASSASILYYKGDTSEFLNQPRGISTQDIFRLAKDYLKLDLRAVLNEAKKENKVAISKKIRVLPLNQSDFHVIIMIFPLEPNKLGDDTFFIVFDKIEDSGFIYKKEHFEPINNHEVALLEDELMNLKERLQVTIEELETSNEELQSTNEELQSTNEELQSTNEELETSNEELQSTNEELQTVNDELNFKNVELEFTQQAFNDVLVSLNADVLIVDKSLNIVKYTEGILKFFQISKTGMDNFSKVLLNSTVHFPNLLADLQKCLNQGTKVQYEITLGKKVFLFKINKISMGLLHQNEKDDGLVLSFLDKTDSFEKDKIMFQQSKMASMGEMIGNIAHQWRQPLNILGLNIATLIDKIKNDNLNDTYLKKFETIYQREILTMSSTIDDFKNFFEPTKNYTLNKISDAIDQSYEMMEDSFKFNSITINKKNTRYKFFGSRNELSQVLLNIFSNSKDAFIENDIQERTIDISFKKQDKFIIITIKDNAGGVDKKLQNKLGKPYVTSKKDHGGTGIGLYMSNLIIEKMGGKIEYTNHPNEGLEIKIYLLCEEK